MTASAVFDEIHGRVFSALEAAAAAQQPAVSPAGGGPGSWDVRDVLEARRRQVLAGVVLAFSRVIPLEMAPGSHPLWRLAEEFGARCSTALTPEVTHVVAMSRATEKVPSRLAAWAAAEQRRECAALQEGRVASMQPSRFRRPRPQVFQASQQQKFVVSPAW